MLIRKRICLNLGDSMGLIYKFKVRLILMSDEECDSIGFRQKATLTIQ